MRSNEEYMQLAIDAAVRGKHGGGAAIGAVVVDSSSGKVIAQGASMVGPMKDPTAHAEINCIRAAAKMLATDDLFACTLFSTVEPCHMCLSASAWARIPRLFFGAYRKDVDESLFDIKGDFSDEKEGKRMNLRENLTMNVVGGLLEKECARLLTKYHDGPKHARRIV
ncbi:MAG TPA: nucleoside deaminase [Candidatus Saccharimonadia bacterium]|jgi:tRNA(Arg) A34 adenosine deaminase TadA|nr:nucleoside deaminase [Candidatus Saccharimonadia bacterium]